MTTVVHHTNPAACDVIPVEHNVNTIAHHTICIARDGSNLLLSSTVHNNIIQSYSHYVNA